MDGLEKKLYSDENFSSQELDFFFSGVEYFKKKSHLFCKDSEAIRKLEDFSIKKMEEILEHYRKGGFCEQEDRLKKARAIIDNLGTLLYIKSNL